MSIILFLIILLVLVLSHEFGHFVVSKLSGIRVEEFGFGFPPRAFGVKKGDTVYSLNWLPFGGFVRLLGEEPEEEVSAEDKEHSFSHKPIWKRLLVVIAGVIFNLLLAWILIVIGFLSGLPMPVGAAPTGAVIGESRLVITEIRHGSPAEKAGLMAADTVTAVTDETDKMILAPLESSPRADSLTGLAPISPDSLVAFVQSRTGHDLLFSVRRSQKELLLHATPAEGVVPGRAAIGVGLDSIAAIRLPLPRAILEAGKLTASLTVGTVQALASLVADIFRGAATREAITGPIGIIALVGTARSFGWIFLLGLTAIISINLAVINLLPIPALDGGHVLFLIIEALRGKPLSAKVRGKASAVCFIALIALMVLVTISDILKLLS